MKILLMILALVFLLQISGVAALAADGCCPKDVCKCANGVCYVQGACKCPAQTCCAGEVCKCGQSSCSGCECR